MLTKKVCYCCVKKRWREEAKKVEPDVREYQKKVVEGYAEMDAGKKIKWNQVTDLHEAWKCLRTLTIIEDKISDLKQDFGYNWDSNLVQCPCWYLGKRLLSIKGELPRKCPYPLEHIVNKKQ